MKVAYVAGKYRAPTIYEIVQNIRAAEAEHQANLEALARTWRIAKKYPVPAEITHVSVAVEWPPEKKSDPEARLCANGPRCVRVDPTDSFPQPAVLDAANPRPLCRGCQMRAGVA